MNKKGLVLIFLFVVSAVGAVTFTQAATDNQVEVTLQYIPSAYVEMGEVYVEFDSRFLDDNMVFGEDDTINFAFFYDVAVETWGGAHTYGGGIQPEMWYYETPDPNSTCLYTETRFVGVFDVLIDQWDIGMTNFDIWADNGNYQDIVISLDIGWHTMTIVAAELISDCNHTTWEWTYAKDQKRFYVSEDKDDTAALSEDANYNAIDVLATPVNSEDLKAYYDWDSFLASPRAIAEATLNQYTIEVMGTEAVPVVTDFALQWNTSDNVLTLADGPYGLMYDNIYEMGPATYMWIVNDQPAIIANDTFEPATLDVGLYKGQNYIYFVLFGFRVDDYSQLYGNPAPQLATSTVRFDLWLGDLPEEPTYIDPCPECEECPEPTPGFGIFISVSMLGLAAVLLLVRRRK